MQDAEAIGIKFSNADRAAMLAGIEYPIDWVVRRFLREKKAACELMMRPRGSLRTSKPPSLLD